MSNFSTEALFKTQIDEIWDNEIYSGIESVSRGYAIQDDILTNVLLFIGINPSMYGNIGRIFYQNSHGETHKYFKKFIDVSKDADIPWSHIDLLFLRETDQKVVKQLLRDRIGHEFFSKQLAISKGIIELAKPKIIVINNTLARDLFQFKTVFDEQIGTQRIVDNTVLEGTPVFFTSMLTGQRALDLGSYERLKWHIRQVINNQIQIYNNGITTYSKQNLYNKRL
jgi:hypothetical protein